MKIFLLTGLLWFQCFNFSSILAQNQGNGIQAYPNNPHYLSWGNTPVFLIGAAGFHSWTPNSRPGTAQIENQLEKMGKLINEINSPHIMGMVRWLPYDPMNHLHDGKVKEVLQPWKKNPDGKYDLSQFSPDWEKRLLKLLESSLEKRIIVVMELWDDWSVTRGPGGAYDPGGNFGWNGHPFNPKNNINYDEETLPATTQACEAPFYQTLPSKSNNQEVFQYQKIYIDHLLSLIKGYPHVLLNVNNESRADLVWSRYWAEYAKKQFPMIGDMPSTNRKDGGGECIDGFNPMALALDPLYGFVDISQGVSGHEFNSPTAQAIEGGKRIMAYREAMKANGQVKPLVVSKDYTRDENGGDIVIWSRFINGTASTRFHRPAADAPPSVVEFQHAAMLRLGKFVSKIKFWEFSPSPQLITKLPEGMAANALSNETDVLVLQLLGGQKNVAMEILLPAGQWKMTWIDPSTGLKIEEYPIAHSKNSLSLKIPSDSLHLIALLEKDE
ncbi:MAG: hypothetical protein WD398_01550 [Cyclobacteriaceae bacterium]